MLAALFNGVLAIFAISVMGFVCGRLKVFDFGSAMILNKFEMFIALPVLGFKLLSETSLFDLLIELQFWLPYFRNMRLFNNLRSC